LTDEVKLQMSCGYLKVCNEQSDMTGCLENDMSAEYEEQKHLFAS